MNWSKAARAAGAGLAAFVIIFLAIGAAFTATFQLSVVGGSPGLTVGGLLTWVLLVPLGVSIAGAIPARALGASWTRGLISSLLAHIAAAVLMLVVLRDTPFFSPPDRGIAIVLTIAACLTLLMATFGPGDIPVLGQIIALIVTAVLIGATFRPDIEVGLVVLAWLLLPPIIAVAQSQAHADRARRAPVPPTD